MNKNIAAILITMAFVSSSVSAVSLQRLTDEKDKNELLNKLPTEAPPRYIYNNKGQKIINYDYYPNKSFWTESAYAIDGAYGVDTIRNGEVGKQVYFNVYNSNSADASLKVYDKNGKVKDIILLKGNSPETNITGFYFKLIKDFYQTSKGELDFNDARNPLGNMGSGHTKIQTFVPEGGKIEISKNSIEAITINYIQAVLGSPMIQDLINDLKMQDSGLFLEYISHILVEASVQWKGKSLPKIIMEGRSPSKEDLKEFIENWAITTLDFLNKKAIKDPKVYASLFKIIGKDKAKNWLTKASATSLSVPLTGYIELSESLASSLTTTARIADLNRHLNGRHNVVIPLASCKDNTNASYCNQQPFNYQNARAKITQMLNSISTNLIQKTSHFGTIQPYWINVSNTTLKATQNTIKENFFLAKGSAIIEAPADIVLNWGSRPADLDSHLTGPINAQSPERFHVNYQNKGSLNSNPNVLLYRDDTSHGVGSANRPEQTRINVTQPGVYNFYVHDFSNQSSQSSRALSNSGAVVSVHTAGNRNLPEGDNLGRKVTQFSVPKDKVGTVWHTFELDTRRNTIKPVNKFHNDTKVIK